MKYIRTKDDIRPICGENHITNIVSFYDKHGKLFNAAAEDSRIADNIEELVDEYVLGETKYHKPCVTKLPLDFLRECVITKTHYELVVYGSIWVDGELHKVAKMNDEGELELL